MNKWGAKINAVIDEKEAEEKIEQILSELNTFINNSDRFVEFDVVEYLKNTSDKAVKKTLTIPSWLNSLAEQNNVNFSNILQNALKEYLNV